MALMRWKITKPGQARIIELALKGAGQGSLQKDFEALGYNFPAGTYVDTGSCNDPSLRICHDPATLDRIEKTFQLERRP